MNRRTRTLWLAALLTLGALVPLVAQAQGSVSLPIAADPTLNPWHPSAFVESVFPNRVLFPGLTKPGVDLQPAADLAESWSASADGMSWIFELRDDVIWHDGAPFTAEDVAFTFNQIVLDAALVASGARNFGTIASVDVVDTHTVRFNLKSPFSALPAYLGINAGILPKHVFEGQGDPWNLTSFHKGTPIGTGPFKVSEFVSGAYRSNASTATSATSPASTSSPSRSSPTPTRSSRRCSPATST